MGGEGGEGGRERGREEGWIICWPGGRGQAGGERFEKEGKEKRRGQTSEKKSRGEKKRKKKTANSKHIKLPKAGFCFAFASILVLCISSHI